MPRASLAFENRIVWLFLWIGAFARTCTAQQDTDLAYPPELELWLGRQDLLAEGITAAEQLRHRLLAKASDGESYAWRVARAIHAFQKSQAKNGQLHESIARFDVTAEQLQEQLQHGSPLDPDRVFHAFEGHWHGLWDTTRVDHDWRSTVVYRPPRRFVDELFAMRATQYAWIHNAFGWNYLAALDEAGNKSIVLGQVYYLSSNDLGRIADSKPHVGYVDVRNDRSNRRLIWITDREIFLEEVLDGEAASATRYVITGLYHDLLSERGKVSGQAVQAIYTRRPTDRPAFLKLTWK
jgi:mRNA-degrading endonuclease YafQ of YafQ-DinJ toxin-antitoxin module